MVEAKDEDMDSEMTENDQSMSQEKMAEGNMAMQMVKQDNIPVAAGETITFKPGSLHVMLIGLNKDLKEGDTITLTLMFEQAGEITLEVPVEQR
jgi:copper(I)-binding protein